MITITDTTTGTTVTCAAHDVAESISGWYVGAPAEVTESVTALETALLRGDYTGDIEAFLAVEIG